MPIVHLAMFFCRWRRLDGKAKETNLEPAHWAAWVCCWVFFFASHFTLTVCLPSIVRYQHWFFYLFIFFPLVEFSDASAKFYCRIYYAAEFHRMREEIMESTEEDFIRSLSHCVNWQARGGKSGAVFYATEGKSCFERVKMLRHLGLYFACRYKINAMRPH